MMNDQPQQAMPQQEPEPQQRKKRKATRLMEIKEPQTVEFNNAGQHSGGKQNTFANDCGVGYDVGLRIGMQGIENKKRKTAHSKESEAIASLKATLDIALSQLEKVNAKLAMQESMNQVPNDICLGVQKTSCGSTSTMDALDTIKDVTKCDLVLPYGEMDQKCATGLVFPYNDGLIHSRALRKDHLKVMIDDVEENFKGLPIPVMTDEVSFLEKAIGTVIQWPRIAIKLAKEQPTQQQRSTTSVVPTTVNGAIRKSRTNQNTDKKPIDILLDHLKINPVPVVADAGILEAETFDFSVRYEEVIRMLKKQTTDFSIITSWQILLHIKFWKSSSKFAFLNPYKISGKACQETPLDVVTYLVDMMHLRHGTSFLVVPYHQNAHWILLVICPSNRVVYILDSLMKDVQSPVDTYYLLKHVELAFARHEKKPSTPVLWIPVECNQQKQEVSVSKSELSGHYVMRWMFEFVTKRQFGFPSKVDTIWKDKTVYHEKMLTSIILYLG